MTKYFIAAGTEVQRYKDDWEALQRSGDHDYIQKLQTTLDVTYDRADIRDGDLSRMDEFVRNPLWWIHFMLPGSCAPWEMLEVRMKDVVISELPRE